MLKCKRATGVNAFTLVYTRSHQFHRCEGVHTGHFGVNAFTPVYTRSHEFEQMVVHLTTKHDYHK